MSQGAPLPPEVPREVRDAARAAFSTRRPGAGHLALQERVETGAVTSLLFCAEGLDVHVVATAGRPEGLALRVDLCPDVEAEAEVERAGGLGRLLLTTAPGTPSARRWVTEWTAL